jgi:hypothetical protein
MEVVLVELGDFHQALNDEQDEPMPSQRDPVISPELTNARG